MKRKLYRICFAISVLIVISDAVPAQNLLRNIQNRAKNKIEERVEDRVEKEADKAIDKQLDQAEEAIFGKDTANVQTAAENNQRTMNLLRGMGINGEPVPHEEQYIFNKLIQMHFESFNSKGEKISTGEFITHLNDNTKHVAYEFVSGDMSDQEKGVFIIDPENGATIIIGEENGEKNAVIYGFGGMFNLENQEEINDIDFSESPENYLANPNVSKTGRTKNIAGYKCSEYTYKDDDTDASYWITEDLKMNTHDFFSALFKTSMYSNGMGWGYLMAGTSINKTNGEKSVMEVTDVNKNSNKTFKMSEYSVTNIGNFSVSDQE